MTDSRQPGRPRSENSRTAILAAALELIGETGYAGLTIEGISARAGVGKQTIYRWWPTKADVLLEAASTKAELHVPVDDHGSYRADLRAFLEASYRTASVAEYAAVLGALMAEAQISPEFGERFRLAFLNRRREALATITDRADSRGDLPPTISSETVADIVFGTLWYRMIATRERLDDTLVEEVLRLLT